MRILGIAGGIGCGKSRVASELAAKYRVPVIDADRLGHELWNEPEIVRMAVHRWGNEILAGDGTVDRRRIAQIVFAGTPESDVEREWLNALMRPTLNQRLTETLRRMESERVKWVILDAALLFEAGWDQVCDAIVFVDATPERRFERWKQREETRGIHRSEAESRAEWERRERAQWAPDRKRKLANFLFTNDARNSVNLPAMESLWEQFVTGKFPECEKNSRPRVIRGVETSPEDRV
ncbi:MAG: dephospho-CoA kinase [Planctomycetia bacterium]|nr:dephospho-CoA kinase [Planctomycetia bacterium]